MFFHSVCAKEIKMAYLSQNPSLLKYWMLAEYTDPVFKVACATDVWDTYSCCRFRSSPLLVILSPYWDWIPPSVVRLCARLMTCANMLSETAITRKLGWFASCRMAMEDTHCISARRGSGSHQWGSCDLANRSSESEPKPHPLSEWGPVCQQRQVPLQKCLGRPGWICGLAFCCGFTLKMREQKRQYWLIFWLVIQWFANFLYMSVDSTILLSK